MDFIEIAFEPLDKGATPRRVTFDLVFLRQNAHGFSEYAAKLDLDADDAAMVKNAVFAPDSAFANMLHAAHFGGRAETSFSVVSINDWADAARLLKPGEEQLIRSTPVLSIHSSVPFQKKLLSELLRVATRANP